MSNLQSTFNTLFEVVGPVIEAHPDIRTLDPVADLKTKPVVRIRYHRKPKLNASSAFMVISKRDKNWIGRIHPR